MACGASILFKATTILTEIKKGQCNYTELFQM